MRIHQMELWCPPDSWKSSHLLIRISPILRFPIKRVKKVYPISFPYFLSSAVKKSFESLVSKMLSTQRSFFDALSSGTLMKRATVSFPFPSFLPPLNPSLIPIPRRIQATTQPLSSVTTISLLLPYFFFHPYSFSPILLLVGCSFFFHRNRNR